MVSRSISAGFCLWLAATCALAQLPVTVGEMVYEVYETAHPYVGVVGKVPTLVHSDVITFPGASYIALHFSNFRMAAEDYVIVRSPSSDQSWRYTKKGKITLENDLPGWFATHIKGDTAIVELFSQSSGGQYGYRIDSYGRGYSQQEIDELWQQGLGEMLNLPERTDPEKLVCGADDTREARCYQTTEPTIYSKSRTVARLLIDGTSLCTGWLVGSQGHVLTNSHCIGSQAEASNTDFEFLAEGATCSTPCTSQLACRGVIEANTSTLVHADFAYDFALVKLPTNVSSLYGFLQMRGFAAQNGERIYIPQHPSGWGKRIAVESTHAIDTPWAKISSLNESGCNSRPGPDVGYFADTRGGSSGSPVLAYSDHLVVALHHCNGLGACTNSGGFFNRGVPVTAVINGLGANLPADAVASCGDTVAPNVSITSPSEGAFVWGALTLTANATDNVGVQRVEFLVNGALQCTDNNGAPWNCSLNVDDFSSGVRQITARAFDACGNSHTSGGVHPYFVNNPLAIIEGPAVGATVSGTVRFFGRATDPEGITSLVFKVDGQTIPATYGLARPDVCAALPLNDPGCPNVGWEAFIDSTLYTAGIHTATLAATDGEGRTTTTPPLTFQVSNSGCVPGPTTLCLLGGRFKVEATFVNGSTETAKSHPFSNETGFFWFFDPTNLELGVKVIGPANGFYWVYHGGATDLQYTLTLTDMLTGAVRSYVKPAGTLCGGGDTAAFPAGGGLAPRENLVQIPAAAVTGSGGDNLGSCTPGSHHLCLLGSRFKVEALRDGVAQSAAPLTSVSGTFRFFSPNNAELLVKVLDGTQINGHFWVYVGSLTDQAYTLKVTDTVTNDEWTHVNPLGTNCGTADITAF